MGKGEDELPLFGNTATGGFPGASSSSVSCMPPVHGVYNMSERRERRDVAFSWIFGGCGLLLLVLGLVCAGTGDKQFSSIVSSGYLDAPQHCNATAGAKGRHLLEQSGDEHAGSKGTIAAGMLLGAVAASLAMGAGLGFVYLAAFKQRPKAMIMAGAAVHIGSFALAAILLFAAGAPIGGVLLLLCAVAAAVMYFMYRDQLDMCARLFGIAANALGQNPGIIGLAVSLWAALGVLFLVSSGFAVAALSNGAVVQNSKLYANGTFLFVDPPVYPSANHSSSHFSTSSGSTSQSSHSSSRQAVLALRAADLGLLPGEHWAVLRPDHCELNGLVVPCCAWQPTTAAQAYMVSLSLWCTWAAFIMLALRKFAIAVTTAQWYWSPAGAAAPAGALMRSVKHGLGPQFGSVAFSAAIMTLIHLARQAMNQRRDANGRGNGNLAAALLCMLARCVASLLLSLIEFLNKFALMWAALTNEGLIDAGKNVTALLARNFLESTTVWWLPSTVVTLTTFALSALWGVLVYLALLAPVGWAAALVVAIICGLVMGVVLHLCGAVLLDIVDTVYLCYVLDKDAAANTRADVHELFNTLPYCAKPQTAAAPGALVAQPDGAYSYAPRDATEGLQMDGETDVKMAAPHQHHAVMQGRPY